MQRREGAKKNCGFAAWRANFIIYAACHFALRVSLNFNPQTGHRSGEGHIEVLEWGKGLTLVGEN